MAGGGRDLLVLALLVAFPSTGFVQKHAGLGGVAAYVAGVMVTVLLTARFGARIAPWCRRHFRWLSLVAFAGLIGGFVVLHPLEDSRGLGRSSDRDDGLELAVNRMLEGQTPYYPSDKFAGPLSVLPGSILLATPFVMMGNSGYQNGFWLAVLLYALLRVFKDKAVALGLLLVPLAVSPAAWYEYVSGGDLLANGIFVAVFMLFALHAWSVPGVSQWQRWLAAGLLGVSLASRPNFLLLLPLVGGVMWQQAGWRLAVAGTGLAALAAAAVTLPFYLHDPVGFTPLIARQKLALVDHAWPWASKAMIGLTLVTGVIGGLWLLLRQPGPDPWRTFFRWATVVTLCPMICAVALFSWVNGRLDFGFMSDRFGLMYGCFALLGWGGRLGSRWERDGSQGTAAVRQPVTGSPSALDVHSISRSN
jgi:hypothetical protein